MIQYLLDNHCVFDTGNNLYVSAQCSQVSMSILKTRFKRCAQVRTKKLKSPFIAGVTTDQRVYATGRKQPLSYQSSRHSNQFQATGRLVPIAAINAGHEPLPEAEARHERTLWVVGSMTLFGRLLPLDSLIH